MEFVLKIKNPVSILVRRRASLGDTVMSTAVVRELYKAHDGNCHITVETDYPLVYKNNIYINDLRNCGEVNPADYDIFYNLDDAYESNPENHFIDSMLNRVFGNRVTALDRSPALFTDANDRTLVDQDIKSIGAPYFAVHMRRWHWELKNISVDTWVDIFAQVFAKRTDHKIVLVGGPTDYTLEHPLIVNYNAKYTPQQLAYFLDGAKCFVGIDSGPFQIAGASCTHIIGLLTHISPEHIMPIRRHDPGWNSTAIQAGVDCVGCNTRQQTPIRGIVCEKGDYPCNRTWNTELIAQTILRELE